MNVEQSELIEIIGEAATIALADSFAGMRLYIPQKISERHEIRAVVGSQAASALVERLGGTTIRIPLVRELRAKQYRAQGMSNGRIAHRLGMTETGVEKLFTRLKTKAPQQFEKPDVRQVAHPFTSN